MHRQNNERRNEESEKKKIELKNHQLINTNGLIPVHFFSSFTSLPPPPPKKTLQRMK